MLLLRLRSVSLASTILLVIGTAGIAHASGQPAISKKQQAGPYTVTLELLPPESFMGPSAEMAWDGAAKPVAVGAPANPNHHLVAFIERDGKPVEKADVAIVYQRTGSSSGWQALPVARMHAAGKGPATTHFGNNVKLEPGDYQARVTVDGKDSASFEFSIPGSS